MKKILLIEDNEDVRENTADILQMANYDIITAEDGRQGLHLAKKHVPDLIVCDIMMPELDGYEVLRDLSKNPKTAIIPFVFLTAKTDRADMRFGMNLGADDYLTKPFEEKELLEAIKSRLNKNEFLKKEIANSLNGFNDFIEDATNFMEIKGLSKGYSTRKYKKKEILFLEDRNANSLYLIETGVVKTYKRMESGKEFVTGIYGKGDFVGQLSLLNKKGVYTESAVVLEKAEICEIPKDDFKKLIYGNQVVSNKFIEMISNNMLNLQRQLRDMAFASVRQRAATCLLNLYEQGIVNDKEKCGIGIPREDFAGIIGTATETAIRTLSEFKEEGLISTDQGRRIQILDKESLKIIADFG